MKEIEVACYEAFSNEPTKGNPAGVVFSADCLSKEQMQEIAYKVGVNETVFILKSEIADYKFRFFTPGQEIALCGHGTIAAVYGIVSTVNPMINLITIETNVGVLPISIQAYKNYIEIEMKQSPAKFITFNGSIEKLADSLGISKEEVDSNLPLVYGSTGTWTLLVPIKKLKSFSRMIPENKLFPLILKDNPKASVHPFCLETYHVDAVMHGRHFSSPFSGTIEDSITGTASGVMGAYYLEFIKKEPLVSCVIEQGHEIGKDGRVYVSAKKENDVIEVFIKGLACYSKKLIISYNNIKSENF